MTLYLINVWFPEPLKNARFQLFLSGEDASAEDGDWSVSHPGGFHFGQSIGYWRVRENSIDGNTYLDILKREPSSPAAVLFWGRGSSIPEMIADMGRVKFPLSVGHERSGSVWDFSLHNNKGFRWKVVGRFS